MKKQYNYLLASMLVGTMSVSGCSSTSGSSNSTAASKFTAGEYTQETIGKNGKFDVTVKVSDDKIESVTYGENRETEAIGTVALKKMADRIVDNQSVGVDTVSGATITSNAVLRAVDAALEEAGGNMDELRKEVEKESAGDIETTADVVVVGGGGAGLAAALSALENGATVTVVEKEGFLGGDTDVNGGIYNTPDEAGQSSLTTSDAVKATIEKAISEEPVSDEHAALMAAVKADYEAWKANGEVGLFDSNNWFALQTWNGGDKQADLELVEVLANESYEGYEWLESIGVEFKDAITQGPGSLYQRTHDTNTGSGSAFVNVYISNFEKYGDKIQIMYDSPADTLLVEDGKVVGVSGTNHDGDKFTVKANNGVILATGGFAANVEMRVEYCQGEKWPYLGEELLTSNVQADVGDGIVMAQEVGANLVDMDQIQLLHMCNPKDGTTNGNSIKNKSIDSIIFVNQEGNRFVAEDERRDVISNAALEQTGKMFYTIESFDDYDGTLDTLMTNDGVSYADSIANGDMFYGETIEELAKAIGADPENLKNAVDAYNANVEANATSDEYGRKTFVNKIVTGPFLAVPRTPAAHHTMGGVQIDEETHVLDTDGNVIAGLYAAGEVTGDIHGGNRLGGNAIVDTVVFGRIAGQSAAQSK